jgi:hypothetical protein
MTQNRHSVGGSVMRCIVVMFLDLPDAAGSFRNIPPFDTIFGGPEFFGKPSS